MTCETTTLGIDLQPYLPLTGEECGDVLLVLDSNETDLSVDESVSTVSFESYSAEVCI